LIKAIASVALLLGPEIISEISISFPKKKKEQ